MLCRADTDAAACALQLKWYIVYTIYTAIQWVASFVSIKTIIKLYSLPNYIDIECNRYEPSQTAWWEIRWIHHRCINYFQQNIRIKPSILKSSMYLCLCMRCFSFIVPHAIFCVLFRNYSCNFCLLKQFW